MFLLRDTHSTELRCGSAFEVTSAVICINVDKEKKKKFKVGQTQTERLSQRETGPGSEHSRDSYVNDPRTLNDKPTFDPKSNFDLQVEVSGLVPLVKEQFTQNLKTQSFLLLLMI